MAKDLTTLSPKSIAVIVAVVAALILIIILNPLVVVDPGEGAVIFNRLTGELTAVAEGTHLKIPVVSTADYYDLKTQKYTKKTEASTLDIQPISLVVTVNYKLVATNLGLIRNNFGRNNEELERIIISPRVEANVKSATALYKVTEIIEKRQELQERIKQLLADDLEFYQVIVQRVSLEDIQFDPDFEKSVIEKQIAEQHILKARNERLEAEETKLKLITLAEGEARKQELLRKTVTKDIIALEWIKKWDGSLPANMLGGGGPMPMVQLPKLGR